MKRLLWNVRLAWLFFSRAGVPLLQAWDLAADDDVFYDDGHEPIEAFESEVSYWNN